MKQKLRIPNHKRFLKLMSAVFLLSGTSSLWATNDAPKVLLTDGSQTGLNGEQFSPNINTPKWLEGKNSYSVKCWQNGIMILEEGNKSTASIPPRTIALLPAGGGAPDMYLVDMGSSLCKIVRK